MDDPGVVLVQVGQAGNQIGTALTTVLGDELARQAGDGPVSGVRGWSTFFRAADGDGAAGGQAVARSVLVDLEPKVVQASIAAPREAGAAWRYPKNTTLVEQSGAANNWACGYGAGGADDALELLRREAEACDFLGGVLITHSLAGGTGSGLGSRLTEGIRDALGSTPALANAVVAPYQEGEVIVQHYNAALTLSRLQTASDAVIVFENDALEIICRQLLSIRDVSLHDMNGVIASNMARLMLPCDRFRRDALCDALREPSNGTGGGGSSSKTAGGSSGTAPSPSNPAAMLDSSRPLELWGDVVAALCPHPAFKLVTLKTLPQTPPASAAYSSFTWPGLTKHARQMVIADAHMEEGINWRVRAAPGRRYNVSVANLAVARGTDLAEAAPGLAALADPDMYAPWAGPDAFTACGSIAAVGGQDKTVLVASNSQTLVAPLELTLEKTGEMLGMGAYVHHYQKYGVGVDDLDDAITAVAQIHADYAGLSPEADDG